MSPIAAGVLSETESFSVSAFCFLHYPAETESDLPLLSVQIIRFREDFFANGQEVISASGPADILIDQYRLASTLNSC